jgi:hypothetical protein
MNQSPSESASLDRAAYLELTQAAKLTCVQYATLMTATGDGKLAIERDIKTHARSIWVHVLDLTEYMINHAPKTYRWEAKLVLISEISSRPDLQPRVGKKEVRLIEDIADFIRRGGQIESIWIIRDNAGNLLLVDGHRRCCATADCQKLVVSAIELKLPFEYAALIARAKNQRHGRNLTSADTTAIVQKFFDENPEELAKLQNGTRSQASLARQLHVPPVAFCRALHRLGHREPAQLPEKPAVDGLRELLLKHLSHKRPDDTNEVICAMRMVANGIWDQWPAAKKRDAQRRLLLNTSAVSRSITPAMKAFMNRRGGDRTSKAAPDPCPAPTQ